MKRYLPLFLMTCITLPCFAEEKPEEIFQLLFGERFKEVQTSRATDDDIKLGQDIYEAAQLDDIGKDLKAYMLKKTVELSVVDESGKDTLDDALEDLKEISPDSHGEVLELVTAATAKTYRAARGNARKEVAQTYLDQLMALAAYYEKNAEPSKARDVYQTAYPVASLVDRELRNELKDRMTALRDAIRKQQELEKLQAAFLENADKATATKIAELLLVDFDNPQKALPFAEAGDDKDLSLYAKLASGVIEDIKAEQALPLAEFYKKHGDNTAHADGTRANMYARSKAYYEHHLENSTQQGIAALKAKVALKQVSYALEKLGGSNTKIARKTIDLMPVIHQLQGKLLLRKGGHGGTFKKRTYSYEVIGKELAGRTDNMDGHTGPILSMPVKVTGDQYTFTIEARDIVRGFAAYLPVKDKFVMVDVVFAAEQAYKGEKIEPKTTPSITFYRVALPPKDADEVHKIEFKMSAKKDTAEIDVIADGKPFFKAEIPSIKKVVSKSHRWSDVTGLGLAIRRGGQFTYKSLKIEGAVKLDAETYDK